MELLAIIPLTLGLMAAAILYMLHHHSNKQTKQDRINEIKERARNRSFAETELHVDHAPAVINPEIDDRHDGRGDLTETQKQAIELILSDPFTNSKTEFTHSLGATDHIDKVKKSSNK